MKVRSGNTVARPGMLVCAVLSVLLGAPGIGWPQSTAPAPPALGLQETGPQAPPPQSTPAPQAGEENPGLINEMGKLFGKLPSILPPIKSPSETMDDLSRMAKPSTMVSGRVACPASPNGAPDCKQAADKLCQGKGYREGKSLNADSAESCSAKVLIPGRQRKPDDCRTDTFVTSALCQN
jgi:hypothetical protein